MGPVCARALVNEGVAPRVSGAAMGYHPVFLDLSGRPCTVIAAGPQGELDRKVEELLEAGARVTCIISAPSPFIEAAATKGDIHLQRRVYQNGDLRGAFLAIAATTGDATLSKRIAGEARREGVILNVIDAPDLCDWIAPATVKRGGLTVAVSTDGLSPAMARFVKNRVDEALPDEYGALLAVAAEIRSELRREGISIDAGAWQHALADGATLDLLREGATEAAKVRLESVLRGGVPATANG